MKKFLKLIFFLFAFSLIFSAFMIYLYFGDWKKGRFVREIYFEIQRGDSLSEIAEKLVGTRILKHKLTFMIFARPHYKYFKAGEYLFDGRLSPSDAVDEFKRGVFVRRKIVVIPGWSMYEVAWELERLKIVESGEEFLRWATSPDFLVSIKVPLKISYSSVEGFLFPDTYYFFKRTDPRDVIFRMVENFFLRVGQARLEKMEKGGFYRMLILASIVEKEATYDFEKSIIASVFLNRLKAGMKLEADPTVMYGLGIFTRPPRPQDLRIDNPYNTYTRYGLPPTPISNPSLSSIDAVLNPAKTDYLYFVSRGDGVHLFAKDYQEHLANINKVRFLKRLRILAGESSGEVTEVYGEVPDFGERKQTLERNQAQTE